jgi:hypothetical protein
LVKSQTCIGLHNVCREAVQYVKQEYYWAQL